MEPIPRMIRKAARLGLFLLFSAAGPYANAQSWTSAASLSQPRVDASAVLLRNGKVLVFGGSDGTGDGYLRTTEVYDPATNTWSPGAPMVHAHGGSPRHVVLDDGRIFACGGLEVHNVCIGDSEMFDPSTESWSARASMPTPRWGHMIVLLADGTVLAAGGQFGYGCNSTASALVYDPVGDDWTPVGSMAVAREFGLNYILLPDGRAMAIGGNHYCQGAQLVSTELYTPSSMTWTAGPSMAFGHESCIPLLLLDGTVLIAGRSDGGTPTPSEVYDPTVNAWTSARTIWPSPVGYFPMVMLEDGRAIIPGGYSFETLPIFLTVCKLYDPQNRMWMETAALLEPRSRHFAVRMADGRVLIGGGVSSAGPMGSVEIFNPNAPPSFAPPIGDQSVDEGQLLEFEVRAVDPEGGPLSYSASNLPAGASFDPASRVFRWTPAFDQCGSYPGVLFTATDNGRLPMQVSEAITISVGNVNRPPSLVLDQVPPRPIAISEGQSLAFSLGTADQDGDAVALSAGNLPTGSTFNPTTGRFTWTPDFGQAGNYALTFTVTDDGTPPLQVSEQIAITVNHVNRPPVLGAIGNKMVNEGQLLAFKVTATDPDGDALVFSANNLPPGASFDPGSQMFNWTPAFDQAGSWENIEFTVTDNGNPMELATALISITVDNVNRAPIFTPIGTQQTVEGQPLVFRVHAMDPDGNGITYSTGPLPMGSRFDSAAGQFSWTPGYTQSGLFTIVFLASDDGVPSQVGQLEIIVSVGVPSPCELAGAIISMVTGQALGKPIENAYMANLKKVCPFIEAGKITPALGQMDAFISKVQEDLGRGRITAALGETLLVMAEDLVGQIKP